MRTQELARHILVAMTSLVAVSASGCKPDASSGSTTPTSPTATNTSSASGAGPWEAKLGGEQPDGSMNRRMCFPNSQIDAARKAKANTGTGCPPNSDLASLGLYDPGPQSPQAMTGEALVDGPAEWQNQCCYLVSMWHMGRPLAVDGEARTADAIARNDWRERTRDVGADPLGAPPSPGIAPTDVERRLLAASWAADACAEHASIASFARFALDLLALGAPPDLVADAHRAALDEIEHARSTFEIASALAGEALGPGALATEGAFARTDLSSAAVAAVLEGCIGETEAALLAEEQLAGATDPLVRRALERIARDEADHAALAWRFVAWAVARGDDDVRAAVRDAFRLAPAEAPIAAELAMEARADVWRAYGRLTRVEVAEVRARARTAVIEPSARALLG